MERKELIKIVPQDEDLSFESLKRYRHLKFKPIKIGSKRTIPSDSDDEAKELDELYKNFRQQLSFKRINTPNKVMEAIWDNVWKVAKVTRKVGKIEKFGYSFKGELYLEFFEALHLLESGRLVLIYNDERISMEQAYLLLLGEEPSRNFNDYLVFSHLTKCGYILRKHRPSEIPSDYLEINSSDCIWSLLLHEISGKTIPDPIKTSQHFEQVKSSMDDIKKSIINPSNPQQPMIDEEVELKFNEKINLPTKRKAEDECQRLSKYPKFNEPRSLLDIFRQDTDYIKFEETFQSLNLVELNSYSDAPSSDSNYEITFDLYLPNDGFKKSIYKIPTFHVLVLKANGFFPNHRDIVQLYKKENNVPILVASVSDSKQIHAFLYYFSV